MKSRKEIVELANRAKTLLDGMLARLCGWGHVNARNMDEAVQAAMLLRFVDLLTYGEGDRVSLHCERADFVGPPDSPDAFVICCGEWTDWEEKSFGGTTKLDALASAVEKRLEWEGKPSERGFLPKTPAGMSGQDAAEYRRFVRLGILKAFTVEYPEWLSVEAVRVFLIGFLDGSAFSCRTLYPASLIPDEQEIAFMVESLHAKRILERSEGPGKVSYRIA